MNGYLPSLVLPCSVGGRLCCPWCAPLHFLSCSLERKEVASCQEWVMAVLNNVWPSVTCALRVLPVSLCYDCFSETHLCLLCAEGLISYLELTGGFGVYSLTVAVQMAFLIQKRGLLTEISQISKMHMFSSFVEVSWHYFVVPFLTSFLFVYFFKMSRKSWSWFSFSICHLS
jgi:hypothetical protein